MKYSEEMMRDCVEAVKQSEGGSALRERNFSKLLLGVMQKHNGTSTTLNCILGTDPDGLLMVYMDQWGKGIPKSHVYLRFSEMQGIKVKKVFNGYSFTIQFLDGNRYQIRVPKKVVGNLPNQGIYLDHLISELESKNLHEMENPVFRKKKKRNLLFGALYLLTLMTLEGIAGWIARTSGWKGIGTIVMLLVVAFVHFFLVIGTGLLIEHRKSRRFNEELREIALAYQRTKDAGLLLENLKKMKNPPSGESTRKQYYRALAEGYVGTGQKEEALEALRMIEADSTLELRIIEEQRTRIERLG